MIPGLLVGLVILVVGPGMILSMLVWEDLRMRVLAWISILLSERWFIMSVFGWLLGLGVPLLFTGHVEFIFVPRVISLDVRSDLRMRILAWISTLLDKSWLNLIARWVLGLVIPSLLVGLVILVMSPGPVLSVVVWEDLGVRVLTWVSLLSPLSHNLTSFEGGLVVLEPVLITSWCISFRLPCTWVHGISLIVIPSGESIWIIAPFATWPNGNTFIAGLHKLLTSFEGRFVLFEPMLIASWILGLSLPSSSVGRFILVIVPGVLSIWTILSELLGMNKLFVWNRWLPSLLLERSSIHVLLLVVSPSAVRATFLIGILVVSLSQFFSEFSLGESVIGTSSDLLGLFLESILV